MATETTNAAAPSAPLRPSAAAMALRAAPFFISLAFAPLLLLAMRYGGMWIFGALAFAFLATPLIDQISSHNKENIDPALDQRRLIWHQAVTWIWVPLQLALIAALLAVIGLTDWLTTVEALAVAAALGVATGGVGINYAHELIHQRNRTEPMLGEILLCSTLYGHFRLEHVFGHHARVATPEDPATARRGESFYAFWLRSILGGLASAWRIQRDQLKRRGRGLWSLSNAFWRYGAWAVAWIGLAYALAGGLGVAAFLAQAIVAVTLLELVNYLEHYGLRRRMLESGRYEPTRPHHSWNANHRFSNFLLINLQRHSDHHYKPDRRYPLLQAHEDDAAPQLPHGYAWMVLLALVPPLWFRVMDPRVDAWETRFYGA
ncbi:MAG: alkane 1-monooxygenase [Pseudomonadota bacterium]